MLNRITVKRDTSRRSILGMVRARSPHGSCAESVSWRVFDVQHAVRRFGRVLKFHSNAIARLPPVSVSAGGAGSSLNGRAILPTKTISYALNARGVNAIPTTGANTAAPTRSTASAIARSNANATTGGANV